MSHSLYEYVAGAALLAVPLAVALMAGRRRAASVRSMTSEELMRRHRRINSHLSDPRSESLLEALLVILFCGVVAAAIVTCLSDEEDFRTEFLTTESTEDTEL